MKNEVYKVTVNTDGSIIWEQNGKFHRVGGPAVETPEGTKFWYQKGLRHREDGPSDEYACGLKHWHLNGIWHSEAQFNAEMKRRNAPACDGKTVEIDGVKYKLSAV
jgi:hypothetical protein